MHDYYDLGSQSMPVTTDVADAKRWFTVDCCFQLATKADPDCAMGYWGIAYATGPNYNKQWSEFTRPELEKSLGTAHRSRRSWGGGTSALPDAARVDLALNTTRRFDDGSVLLDYSLR